VVLASGVLMAVLLTAVGHLAYTAWARARQVASANQELQCDGYQVETAANGRMALEKLRERPYDLLLSDLRMPELDGMGLYEELAQHYPHLLSRLIFLTGDTLNAETMRLLEQVGAPRLSKPFTATEVRRVVQQALQAL
jgi:CheY-like chemotaxis protein